VPMVTQKEFRISELNSHAGFFLEKLVVAQAVKERPASTEPEEIHTQF
jgi:hypothetical protein